MKKVIIIALFIAISIQIKASDSLRIYAMGYFFRGEQLRIKINKDWYYKKCNKGLTSFSFYITLPDSTKSGDLLDVSIFRKRRIGFIYRDTDTEIFYEEGIKYCFLLNTHRIRRKCLFEVKWTNGGCARPQLNMELFNPIIPEWARLHKIAPPW